MDINDLSPEMQEKARSCQTPEDILKLAQEEGYELTDEELDGVTGGGIWDVCHSPYYCQADGGCIGRTR